MLCWMVSLRREVLSYISSMISIWTNELRSRMPVRDETLPQGTLWHVKMVFRPKSGEVRAKSSEVNRSNAKSSEVRRSSCGTWKSFIRKYPCPGMFHSLHMQLHNRYCVVCVRVLVHKFLQICTTTCNKCLPIGRVIRTHNSGIFASLSSVTSHTQRINILPVH